MSFTGKTETFLETTLVNDGFFPDVNLGEFQRLYRVPAEYKQELVEHYVRLAMTDCNRALAERKAEWTTAGFASLDAVSTDSIGGKKILMVEYLRAVCCRAMALMVRAFVSLNRRAEAENLAKESDDVSQDYFAQSKHALRRLMGVNENITVELL